MDINHDRSCSSDKNAKFVADHARARPPPPATVLGIERAMQT